MANDNSLRKLDDTDDANGGDARRAAVQFVDSQFGVSKTVGHLQALMTEVTKDKITAETVNAACNCVQNLNLTIKTAMQAARFLSERK